MRRPLALLLGVLALVAACGGARGKGGGTDPRIGQVFYLCCNLRYDPESPTITDAIPSQGTLLPFATRVEVQKVSKDSVQFEAAGHPPITLEYEHGAKTLAFEHYLNRLFVTTDPRLHLKKVPARQVKLVEKGTVAPGMTRDLVVMAIGYPPADRTPSLEATTWTYGDGLTVYFGGDRVSSVRQPGAGAGSRRRRR